MYYERDIYLKITPIYFALDAGWWRDYNSMHIHVYRTKIQKRERERRDKEKERIVHGAEFPQE